MSTAQIATWSSFIVVTVKVRSSFEPHILRHEAESLERGASDVIERPRVELDVRHSIGSRGFDDVTKQSARHTVPPVLGMYSNLVDLIPASCMAKHVLAAPLRDHQGIAHGEVPQLRDPDLGRRHVQRVQEPILEA